MKIALAQINPTVGDIPGNRDKIVSYIEKAKTLGADLVVFPELALTGYPPKDLLLKPRFIDDNILALEAIAKNTRGIFALVGFARRNLGPVGRPLWNTAALLGDGKVLWEHHKRLLPTYDVFDESRYFEPGPDDATGIFTVGGTKIGASICEDLWNDEHLIQRRLYHDNPIEDLAKAGARVVVNCSASPFVVGKHEFRRELFAAQAIKHGIPIVYVNQVGGNDELVFDGASMMIGADGNLIAQAKDFEEDLLVVDLANPRGCRTENVATGIESIRRALTLGLKDYAKKCGFKSVVLGLSGGIDSAVTAAIAADALGPDKVVGVGMPSRYSSDHSLDDARKLAKNLGIGFHVVPIEEMHKAYETTVYGHFPKDEAGENLTDQNLQARIRGAILMAFSNRFNHLLLTTGNKSELAVGYCTIYGDMCGGLAVISDVPKTAIYQLAKRINEIAGFDRIPQNSLDKPPSAELRPNQTDQDSLPPYDVLDGILQLYVEEEKSVEQIVAAGYEQATVKRITRLCDRSEYKRRQAAPGLKVTSRAFGFGRRMPIAQNYREGDK